MSGIIRKYQELTCTLCRAYTSGLLKSVLFRCHYNKDNDYPSFEDIVQHLNKTSHKLSFLVSRDDVGSTTYESSDPLKEEKHSFGVPRYFFRFSLTSSLFNIPYAYVHWVKFRMNKCRRTSFEGSMTRDEWTTGPTQRPNINPFSYIEDVIPSRFALGFDMDEMEFNFFALDPERVGLENIEVPQVCDFGDNALEYMTARKNTFNEDKVDDNGIDDDNDDDALYNFDKDSDDDDCVSVGSRSNSSDDDNADDDRYNNVLPTNFVAFLRS